MPEEIEDQNTDVAEIEDTTDPEVDLEDVGIDDDEDDTEEETETDEGEGSPEADTTQQPVSRRTLRVQKLEKERDEAARETKELRERLAETQAQMRNGPQFEEARRAEAARVAAMDPLDRERYEGNKKIEALQAQVNNLGFAQADGLDRARFEAKAELNPVYKKYAPAVEEELQKMRANGVNTTREAILTYKLGEAARKKLEQGSTTAQKTKAAAASRVKSAKANSANVRGDASATGKGKTEEDRLRGVQI